MNIDHTESAAPARRSRLRAAGPLVLALMVTGLVAGCVEVPPGVPTVGAAIAVTPSTEGIAPGSTVTVTGTGFNAAGNIGTRPPFYNQPAGVYVVLARITNPWKPSEGGTSANRQIIDQVWALPAAQFAALGGASAEVALMNPDGSFSVELALTEAAGTGDYAIITYAGSGAVNSGEELSIPVSFSAPI